MGMLEEFIQSNRDPRELKRALAVQMSERGHSYREIRDVLQVSLGFITTCTQRYQAEGVEGLRLKYWGTQGYLNARQKQELFAWLVQEDAWTIEEVIAHIEDIYNVVYRSQQSYYAMLQQAGFSWKKSQPIHPERDETQVEEKKLKLWIWCSSGEGKLPVGKCG
jgi:putative transposase